MIGTDEKATLSDFAEVAGQHGISFLVVGAGARLLMLDWKYNLPASRTTLDWDLAVNVSDWDTFRELLGALTTGPNARFTRTATEHRLRHASGIPIDIIPFGEIEQDGKITWPEDSSVMGVHGFQEVYSNAQWLTLDVDCRLAVAAVPGLAVLKLFSFYERRRGDDLRDLYFIVRHYAGAGNEDRIFDELHTLLSDKSFSYEVAGAYLLGQDIRRIVRPETREQAIEFLTKLVDPYCPDFKVLLERFGDEKDEEQRRAAIAGQFAALKAGLENG